MELTKNKWIDIHVEGIAYPRLCIRSDFKDESGDQNYCIAQLGWNDGDKFVTRYKTLTIKELRNLVGAKSREKLIIKES